MEVMFVLLPAALLFAAGAVVVFLWAVRSGQMDDLETPAVRMLFEDTDAKPPVDDESGDRHNAPHGGNHGSGDSPSAS